MSERRARLVAGAAAAVAAAALLAGAAGVLPGAGGGSEAGGRVTAAGEQAGQPVTEFAPAERGEPVQLSGATLAGGRLDVADLRGRVVVVNVWGSWCAPCRAEAPMLQRLSQEYAARGVAVVGVNTRDNRAAAIAFEQNLGIGYPSIDDADGRAVLGLTRRVPASAVPVTLVLDRDGRAAARVLGEVREATLRALLDPVLAEPE